jgi:hypothetical protein
VWWRNEPILHRVHTEFASLRLPVLDTSPTGIIPLSRFIDGLADVAEGIKREKPVPLPKGYHKP